MPRLLLLHMFYLILRRFTRWHALICYRTLPSAVMENVTFDLCVVDLPSDNVSRVRFMTSGIAE